MITAFYGKSTSDVVVVTTRSECCGSYSDDTSEIVVFVTAQCEYYH